MKKIILILCLPVFSWAQFTKGNKFISGNVGFDNQNNTYKNGSGTDLYQTFSISPSFGIFLRENFAIGVSAGYSGSYQHNAGSQPNFGGESKTGTLLTGLFARKYFTLSEKFFFAINGGLSYNRSTNTSLNYFTNLTNETKNYVVGIYASPLFIYLPSTHWGFQGSIGSIYFYHYYNFTNENSTNDSGISVGGLSLGATYYIH